MKHSRKNGIKTFFKILPETCDTERIIGNGNLLVEIQTNRSKLLDFTAVFQMHAKGELMVLNSHQSYVWIQKLFHICTFSIFFVTRRLECDGATCQRNCRHVLMFKINRRYRTTPVPIIVYAGKRSLYYSAHNLRNWLSLSSNHNPHSSHDHQVKKCWSTLWERVAWCVQVGRVNQECIYKKMKVGGREGVVFCL